jgi:hypothetical protein
MGIDQVGPVADNVPGGVGFSKWFGGDETGTKNGHPPREGSAVWHG